MAGNKRWSETEIKQVDKAVDCVVWFKHMTADKAIARLCRSKLTKKRTHDAIRRMFFYRKIVIEKRIGYASMH